MQNKEIRGALHELCDVIADELEGKAYSAIMIPVPVEYLEKADIRPNDKLIVSAEDGKVVIQSACYYECKGDCDNCLASTIDCDGDCENCPCRNNCDESEVEYEE